MKVFWTEQAWQQLVEIESFVARNNPDAASRLVDRLVARGDTLASNPTRGRKLPEMPRSGFRELIVDNYRIVYRRTPKNVEVVTVFEGHRLLRRDELPE